MEELCLIMKTLTGGYLNENNKKNIGHECINFFAPKNTDDEYYFGLMKMEIFQIKEIIYMKV
ncbi:MAG TPA: hypothetical protein PLH82_03395 [Candidatus Paceibacterota bacterium]|nr:hypothetical protein [Candidatus Paceibacterota bacterium]